MNKTWTLIKREFITKTFTRAFLISTLIGPIFLASIFLIPIWLEKSISEEPMYIHAVDESKLFSTKLAYMFNDTLSNGRPRFVVTPISPESYYNNREDYENSLLNDEIDAILFIPSDVLSGNTIKLLVKKTSRRAMEQLLRQRLTNEINKQRLIRAGIDPEEIEKLSRDISLKVQRLHEERETDGGNELIAIIFALMLYTTTIMYGTMVMRGVLEEKTSRILEILLSSSSPFQLMMGKLIGVGSAGLVQYLIWITLTLVGYVALQVSSPVIATSFHFQPLILFYFVVFFLLAYFQFSALFSAVGAITSSQEDAQAASSPVIILLIIPFITSLSLGVQAPDTTLSIVLSFLPFFSPMMLFMRIVMGDTPWWQIVAGIALNGLLIVILTWMSARIYRIGILMYGKRPHLMEVLRWIGQK
ncbi:MAG: ABC transporter permease [Calditrichaeota bacterium]|nr:MAG: ABC transporter permease [Calditrichota bacterium]